MCVEGVSGCEGVGVKDGSGLEAVSVAGIAVTGGSECFSLLWGGFLDWTCVVCDAPVWRCVCVCVCDF